MSNQTYEAQPRAHRIHLDFELFYDTERCAAIHDTIKKIQFVPNSTDLEKMADYILYGKDEKYMSAVDRGMVLKGKTKHTTYQTTEDKNQSLDQLMESVVVDERNFQAFDQKKIYKKAEHKVYRPKFDAEGNLIDIGDGDIEILVQLWKRIDELSDILDQHIGKKPKSQKYIERPLNPWQISALRHMLIDLRSQQHAIKDSYKPIIYAQKKIPVAPSYVNWGQNTGYWLPKDEWKRKYEQASSKEKQNQPREQDPENDSFIRTINGVEEYYWLVSLNEIDYEKPSHIVALIKHYGSIYQDSWEDLNGWRRILIRDFENYVDYAKLSPIRQYVLEKLIEKWSHERISLGIKEKFDIEYDKSYMSAICSKEIPTTIARAATFCRVWWEHIQSDKIKKCKICKKQLPRHILFFGKNASRKDGFAPSCRDCERNIRISRGLQGLYDERTKDPDKRIHSILPACPIRRYYYE